MRLERLLAKVPDAIWAPCLEAAMLLVAGALSLAFQQAWLFASLGPTAYEIAEHPQRPSSRPYAVIVGHFVALGVALATVALLGAWNTPSIDPLHGVTRPRLLASVIAAALSAALNILLKTSQPASVATALLVALGTFQSGRGAFDLAMGILIVALLGIPLRQLGQKRREAGAFPPALAD